MPSHKGLVGTALAGAPHPSWVDGGHSALTPRDVRSAPARAAFRFENNRIRRLLRPLISDNDKVSRIQHGDQASHC